MSIFNNHIQAVLFDVDGTLLDTSEFIFQAFEYAFKEFHLAVPSHEELKKVVGQELKKCYLHFYPESNWIGLCESHRDFQMHHLNLSKPFPHTAEVLKKLKDESIKIAAVTTRSNLTATKTLTSAQIIEYFDILVTADDVKEQKPSPEGIFKALKFLMVDPKNAVMVGDTESDVLAGKNAGTRTIGVTYGFVGKKIKAARPDVVINDISDIFKI